MLGERGETLLAFGKGFYECKPALHAASSTQCTFSIPQPVSESHTTLYQWVLLSRILHCEFRSLYIFNIILELKKKHRSIYPQLSAFVWAFRLPYIYNYTVSICLFIGFHMITGIIFSPLLPVVFKVILSQIIISIAHFLW